MTNVTCRWFIPSNAAISTGAKMDPACPFDGAFQFSACYAPALNRNLLPEACDYESYQSNCPAYEPRSLANASRHVIVENHHLAVGTAEVGLGYPDK